MIEITATGDTTLHTAGKYCEEDILVNVPAGGSGGGSGAGVETCTVTISNAPAGNLVWTTVENGEIVMRSHYMSFPIHYIAPSITCVKNSFICMGYAEANVSVPSDVTLSGGIELIPVSTNDSNSRQDANTVGRIFKVTGDATISME